MKDIVSLSDLYKIELFDGDMLRILIFFIVILITGCSGATCNITANKINYPVSLSKSFYDKSGEIIIPKESEIIDHFSISWKNWNVLFVIPLYHSDKDISSILEEKIQSKDGDAIVNMTVTAQSDWYGAITCLALIIPSYINMEVQGDVVKLDK